MIKKFFTVFFLGCGLVSCASEKIDIEALKQKTDECGRLLQIVEAWKGKPIINGNQTRLKEVDLELSRICNQESKLMFYGKSIPQELVDKKSQLQDEKQGLEMLINQDHPQIDDGKGII